MTVHPITLDLDHRYWVPDGTQECGSRQVVGFSELCAAMGVTRPNPFYTAQGRAEGVALHKWLHFLVLGKVPTTPPHPSIAGRVDGIRKFIERSGVKFVGGESPRYDPKTGVACTKDLWGYIGPWSYVIDAKRGAKQKVHRLQTACQSIVLRANDFRPQKRAALYLRDGDYRFDDHDDRSDETNWLHIVAGYHAMTPDERKIFASEEFDLEDFGRAKPAKFRLIANAHAARMLYRS